MAPTTRRAWLTRPAVVATFVVAGLLSAVPSVAHEGGHTCKGLEVTILGATAGDDVINGTPGPDVIQGLGGDDVIYGAGGDDVICGGGGNDRIVGEDGNDILIGGPGDDWLTGGDGDDDLRGNNGDDRLYANRGDDVARGGKGSDACGSERSSNCEMRKRWGHEPDRWMEHLETHFGPLADQIGAPDLVEEALVVMACESAGQPFAENPRSTASGLFQFLDGTWDRWNPRTDGWAGESVFHPEANIATAARLVLASVQEGQDRWWQWSCKPY